MKKVDFNAVEAVMREMILEAAHRLDISPHALTAKIERLLDEELRRREPVPFAGTETGPDPLEVTWFAALKSEAPDAPEDDLIEIVQDLFERLVSAVEQTSGPRSLH